MIDLCKEPETTFFPSRQTPRRLEGKSFVVLDVEEATGRPRLAADLHVAPNPRNGLFVSNNPVNLWDPWGLFDVGFYGAGGNTVGNAALRDYVEGRGGKVYDRTQKGQQQALEDIKKAREAGNEC